MKTMKMQYMLILLSLGLFSAGCGGSGTPVTPPASSYVGNSSTEEGDVVVSGSRFKTPQEAISWLAKFYKSTDIDIDGFKGQLESLYQSGIPLGHIFILARLSYVTGIEPVDLVKIKEGDNGWTAVMEAFQIKGLGGFANLGDLLKDPSGGGLVDRNPGTK